MAEPAEKRWTVEEFLAWDDGTGRRYELVLGKIVELAPPSEADAAIMATLAGLVHGGLERPCRALIRAGVVPPDRDDTYYQADLLVTCAPPLRGRQRPPDPILVAEGVLAQIDAAPSDDARDESFEGAEGAAEIAGRVRSRWSAWRLVAGDAAAQKAR